MNDLDTLCENCGHMNRRHYGGAAHGESWCVGCREDETDTDYDNPPKPRCMSFEAPPPPMVLNPCQNCGHEWSLHIFSEDGKLLLTCNLRHPDKHSVSHCACALFASKWGGDAIPKDPNYFPRPEEEYEIQ